MKLLGVDLETGGSFDADIIKDNFITEIGAVLWDTELGQPVKMLNELVFMGRYSINMCCGFAVHNYNYV